ncbi:GMC family oxidoreductase N-terminal domain-containing protein [Chondromyces apiculatus]|uniref:Oxidoreductase, GMC family n=1 Tax=Chondromyces apiculatus DSM 436 TaxID=1192034 RepID=A0A017T266_9BACT|nr:GMC family oxidoreductase N-terminal domain-containing protein [Chondromyces apiculatus]EYF03364.1 Oxidoreductase, GMC family [Chondromyces apiculatus DSM 436]
MIYDAGTLALPLHLKADLCVVGSGAGGAMVAMVAAEAGMKVVLLEAGEFLTPADMVQREEVMLPRLYWEAGGRTTADRAVHIHQGKGVGGSTLHNLNLCKRIPASIRARWAAERRLERLPVEAWDALYAEVEALLEVKEVPPGLWNRHNRLLEAGCKALGWRGGGVAHNRTGCVGSGFCEVGCAYDAKNNAVKVLVPRAVKAGAEILARCQAVLVRHEGGRVSGVSAVGLEPGTNRPLGEVTIDAPRVCVAGSATATPALLLRSEVPDPGGETGKRLRIHPALVAAGEFDEPVRAWEGIPQTYECTELLDLEREDGPRAWIIPAFAHPVGTATLLPGHGEMHRSLMRKYAHLAAFTAMIHDHTAGEVQPDGDLGLRIDYWPDAADRQELCRGLHGCAALLFAAGARRVIVPSRPTRIYERGDSIEELKTLTLTRGAMDVTAVHPMASVPMGDDPAVAAVSSEGKHHHLGGLWVGDGSLFPTSIGVPPQLSIYAMGLHVGRAIARS